MHEKPSEDWTLFTANGDDGITMWQFRENYPSDLSRADFPISIVIEWAYADSGAPTKQVLAELHEFEGFLDSLNNVHGNSLLVHIIRGHGISELCYYCRDYDIFMEQLNAALAGQRAFPIEILYDTDPTWNYCHQTRQELGSLDC